MDSEALSALNRMAEALAQAQGFSVTIRAGFDVVQDTGQKITFGERRKITLSRPERLRVEAEESDGKRTLVIYDGKAITVFNPGENVYGQIEKAGSVDDAVRYVVQGLGMRLPLALMLVTTLPAELDQRLQSIDCRQQGYTERTDVRQQGATERTEARASAAQNINSNNNGDNNYHHDDDDDEWGYALAGAAVGATLGYVAGPTYVTVLPCSPTVVAAGGTSYYGCGGSSYNQAYVNGSVTYVTVTPPPGYYDRRLTSCC